jgi:hypothetical protein
MINLRFYYTGFKMLRNYQSIKGLRTFNKLRINSTREAMKYRSWYQKNYTSTNK